MKGRDPKRWIGFTAKIFEELLSNYQIGATEKLRFLEFTCQVLTLWLWRGKKFASLFLGVIKKSFVQESSKVFSIFNIQF